MYMDPSVDANVFASTTYLVCVGLKIRRPNLLKPKRNTAIIPLDSTNVYSSECVYHITLSHSPTLHV